MRSLGTWVLIPMHHFFLCSRPQFPPPAPGNTLEPFPQLHIPSSTHTTLTLASFPTVERMGIMSVITEVEGKALMCQVPHKTQTQSKGDPITKRFTAKFPLPAAPWSSFQLLECLEAPGHKPRDSAVRAGDQETSRNEAGGETPETHLNSAVMPAGGEDVWLSENSMCIQLFRKTALCETTQALPAPRGSDLVRTYCCLGLHFLLPGFQPVVP